MKFPLYDPTNRAFHIRDLFNMNTPLKDVPPFWLLRIEHHVHRLERFNNCWIWTGAKDQRTGEPLIYMVKGEAEQNASRSGNQRVRKLVKRVIAKLFVDTEKLPKHADGEESFDVIHLCQNITCINPAHLQVRVDHGSQRTKSVLVKARKKFISKAEVYTP